MKTIKFLNPVPQFETSIRYLCMNLSILYF